MKTQDYKFSIIDLAVSESYKEEEEAARVKNEKTLWMIKNKLGRQARKMASVVNNEVYVGPYKFRGKELDWWVEASKRFILCLILEDGTEVEINNLADLGWYIRNKQK